MGFYSKYSELLILSVLKNWSNPASDVVSTPKRAQQTDIQASMQSYLGLYFIYRPSDCVLVLL